MKNKNLQILMSVHNEAGTIGKQIFKIHKILKKRINFSFLICEDGSIDGIRLFQDSPLIKFHKKYIE